MGKNDRRTETWPPLIVGNKYIYLRLSDNLPNFLRGLAPQEVLFAAVVVLVSDLAGESASRRRGGLPHVLWRLFGIILLHLIVFFSVCIFDFTLFFFFFETTILHGPLVDRHIL